MARDEYVDGLVDGFRVGGAVGFVFGYNHGRKRGYKSGYVDGYVDSCFGISPPAEYQGAISREISARCIQQLNNRTYTFGKACGCSYTPCIHDCRRDDGE